MEWFIEESDLNSRKAFAKFATPQVVRRNSILKKHIIFASFQKIPGNDAETQPKLHVNYFEVLLT